MKKSFPDDQAAWLRYKFPAILKDADLEIIDDTLNSFIPEAKPKQRAVIQRIQSDIRNKDFLAQFDINTEL